MPPDPPPSLQRSGFGGPYLKPPSLTSYIRPRNKGTIHWTHSVAHFSSEFHSLFCVGKTFTFRTFSTDKVQCLIADSCDRVNSNTKVDLSVLAILFFNKCHENKIWEHKWFLWWFCFVVLCLNLIMHYCARNFDDNATNISNFLVHHSFSHFRASATEVIRK